MEPQDVLDEWKIGTEDMLGLPKFPSQLHMCVRLPRDKGIPPLFPKNGQAIIHTRD